MQPSGTSDLYLNLPIMLFWPILRLRIPKSFIMVKKLSKSELIVQTTTFKNVFAKWYFCSSSPSEFLSTIIVGWKTNMPMKTKTIADIPRPYKQFALVKYLNSFCTKVVKNIENHRFEVTCIDIKFGA